MMTRRRFCVGSGIELLLGPRLAHGQAGSLYGSSRPDVAVIDHERILKAADGMLSSTPAPLTSLSPAGSKDFFMEDGFEGRRDALFTMSRQVAALAAAYQLTHEKKYAEKAMLHLRAWFIDPETRMQTSPESGGSPQTDFPKVLGTVFLGEVVQACTPLKGLFEEKEADALQHWFGGYLTWLTTSKTAGLARDQRDHHGSSWLLQAAAYARFTNNEMVLEDLRHRFKSVTLRAQIVADGSFPHEVASSYPYRNSLFNMDLLAAACQLLSTQFESLWEYELQDGPGLHTAMSRLYPFIQDRKSWPYRADLDHFNDLPLRRSSLLFAARAYSNPDYATLWKSLSPETDVHELDLTLPVSQPLLWMVRARL